MPQDIESTLGHLSKADLLALIKRMVQLYPDLAGLIETAQQTTPSQRPQRLPFNPEFYRRQRENYQVACQYLTSIRRLYQKLGKSDTWTRYIAALREQHRNLPALKDELAKAKL